MFDKSVFPFTEFLRTTSISTRVLHWLLITSGSDIALHQFRRISNEYINGYTSVYGVSKRKTYYVNKAVLALYRIAFAPLPKSYERGLLFTHKKSCGGSISVMKLRCPAPISQVESHISDGQVFHTILVNFLKRHEKLSATL